MFDSGQDNGADQFYVYMMFHPNTGMPCYVGKGKGDRYQDMYRYHNPHLRRIIKKNGGKILSLKFAEGLTEAQSHSFEVALIKEFGREHQGGILTNLTDGGDGMTGWVPSAETRAKISKAILGRKHTAEACAKMSASHKERGGPSPEARINIAAAAHARKGIPMSADHRANMMAVHSTAEYRQKKRDLALAQHANMTDAQKAERARVISAATREAMKDPEKIQRLREVAKVAHAKRARTNEGRFA